MATLQAPSHSTESRNACIELDAVIDALEQPLLVADDDGTILSWNLAAEHATGYSRDEVLDRSISTFLRFDEPDEFSSLLERIRAGVRIKRRAHLAKRDGMIIGVALTLRPIRNAADGRVSGFVQSMIPSEPLRGHHDTEQLLRLVLDNIPQGVFWKDLQLTYLGCNRFAARHAGLRDPAEIVGKTDEELAWRGRAEKYRRDDIEVIRTGVAKLNIQEEILHPNGSLFSVSTSKVPLRDQYGNVIGVLGTYEDHTDRLRANEALRLSEERFALAMRGANDGVWDCDLPSRRLAPSERLLAILGIEAKNLESLDDLRARVHALDLEQFDRAMDDYLNGSASRFDLEHRLRHSDGHYIFVLARGFAVRSEPAGAPLRFIGTLTDISELKAAQQSLQATVEELRRSNEELERFAYVASHDLQEPLRMVASFTQLLAEKYQGKLDEKADKYIGYAVDGARRMQELINDLLALSRVGTQAAPFTLVSTQAVMDEVRSNLGGKIAELGAELVVGGLPQVCGDRTQLVQLFQNLVGNALKFHRNLPPRVEVRARLQGTHWCFEVQDNGIGIETAYLERIFVIFQRLHERGRYAGSGIGLAIAKKIVERHGGHIWVESQPDVGSRFLFTLPATVC